MIGSEEQTTTAPETIKTNVKNLYAAEHLIHYVHTLSFALLTSNTCSGKKLFVHSKTSTSPSAKFDLFF